MSIIELIRGFQQMQVSIDRKASIFLLVAPLLRKTGAFIVETHACLVTSCKNHKGPKYTILVCVGAGTKEVLATFRLWISLTRDSCMKDSAKLSANPKPHTRCQVDEHYGAEIDNYFATHNIEFTKLVFSGNEACFIGLRV